MTKNEKKLILRHCGVPCCGTCKWYKGPCYEGMECNHPATLGKEFNETNIVMRSDFVCNLYEVQENNAEELRDSFKYMYLGEFEECAKVFDDRVEIELDGRSDGE